jgi:hypothetical protein
MKRLALSMFAVVLTAGTTWAGPATFSYDWTPGNLFVSGSGMHNILDFSNQPTVGPLTTLSTVGNASSLTWDNTQDDVFNNVAYTMKVKITDNGESQSAVFAGTISGHIVNGNATDMTATLPAAAPLGPFANGDTFTAQLTAFVPPTFGVGGKPGAFGFQITANGGSGTGPGLPPGGGTKDTPEPSTILLSMLGIGGLGLRAWRNRKRVTA